MSKTLSKCIDTFDYFGEILLVSSATNDSDSFASFGTVIDEPDEIISSSLSSVLSIRNGIAKKLLKQWEKRKRNTAKLF